MSRPATTKAGVKKMRPLAEWQAGAPFMALFNYGQG
jgi:hypothetical protein